MHPQYISIEERIGSKLTRSPPIRWARRNAVPLKFDPMTSEVALSARFPYLDKCRLKVAGEVISGVTVEWVGMDGRVIFGDSRSNRSRESLTLWWTTTNAATNASQDIKIWVKLDVSCCSLNNEPTVRSYSYDTSGIKIRSEQYLGFFSILGKTPYTPIITRPVGRRCSFCRSKRIFNSQNNNLRWLFWFWPNWNGDAKLLR